MRSRSVYCDQCRVVGWSGNPVCTKRYHFIIKADGGSISGYNKSCAECGEDLHLSESRCKSCNHVMTTEDVEDWMYHQLEDTSHLLHGVIHANGYGHLLRVNGREGGSRVLSGRHIMDFWDRLCKVLGVRLVSVMDVSKKYGLEFRLLHAITEGHPWYGNWGYEFGAGSFGLTLEAYKVAVETLSNMPLSSFLSQGRKPRTHLQDLIAFYQSLSERELVSSKELFSFLMTLIHDAHKSHMMVDDTTSKKSRSCDSRVLCAWTTNDIVRVEEAMFRVLRAVTGPTWVSWRSLRGAVCKVGPPELLDYCLKELKGKRAADGMTVNARCIPDSGAIEYRLEPPSSGGDNSSITNCPSEDHLVRDLRFLYECLLNPETMGNHVPQGKRDAAISSATKLLDCKQFVKKYRPEKVFSKTNPFAVLALCELKLEEEEQQHEEEYPQLPLNPPPEPIVLSPGATVSEVKREASKAFQDVYVALQRFQADEVDGYRDVADTTQLIGGSTSAVAAAAAEEMMVITVRGRCVGNSSSSRFRMERGLEAWTVDCSCGARDDDGERMLACDICSVWRHTRCAGIPDTDAAPAKFVCYKCCGANPAKDDDELSSSLSMEVDTVAT